MQQQEEQYQRPRGAARPFAYSTHDTIPTLRYGSPLPTILFGTDHNHETVPYRMFVAREYIYFEVCNEQAPCGVLSGNR